MPENKSKTKDKQSLPSNNLQKSKVATPKAKTTKKVAVKKEIVKKEENYLTIPVYSLTGEETGKMELPKEIFGVKVNKSLLTQALRVYFNNQRAHVSNTKTRGEVKGSTAKIGPQKGSGRARHGSIRAPIWVGGGIALGPKYRKIALTLPNKMKKAALMSALSTKASEGEILGVSGLDKISGKTKEMQKMLIKINKNNVLILTDGKNEKLTRAVRNLLKIDALSVEQVNPWLATSYQTLILTKEAVKKLESRIKNVKLEEESPVIKEIETKKGAK